MTFDATITLGSLLTLVACVGTVALGILHFNKRIDLLEWRLDLVWRWFQKRYGPNGDNSRMDDTRT